MGTAANPVIDIDLARCSSGCQELALQRDLPLCLSSKTFAVTAVEWLPERVTSEDLAQFDYALVLAHPEGHAELAQTLKLQPGVPSDTPWRLYKTR